MNRKSFWLLSIGLVYTLGVFLSCALIYSNTKSHSLSQIDNQLSQSILRTYKDLNYKNNHIIKSYFPDERIHKVDVIGTVVKLEGDQFVTLNNNYQTIKDLNRPILKSAFHDVLKSKKIKFLELNLKDNSYRVAILPIKNKYDIDYILLTSHTMVGVEQVLNNNTIIIVLIFSLLLMLIVPLIMNYKKDFKKRYLKIINDAKIDPITGIPNQQQLLIDLEESSSPNLAFLKILNYNGIINQYGPAVTDSIARQFSTILNAVDDERLKKGTIYRVQQSTFAILEDQDISFNDIADITGKIVKSLVEYDYMVGENEFIKLNITVGAVRQKKDAFTLANMALSEALDKQLPYYFIDGESNLPKTYKRDLEITKQIHLAIKENRLKPFFQPIFDAKSLDVVKYESLARIVDENNQPTIPPNVFLALAAREKIIYKITRIIVAESVKFAIKNKSIVSINLSIADINNEQTREFIYSSIKGSTVSHLLHFELLENEAIVDSENVLKFIAMIQNLGSQIGMDDLGKGYSNIERLMNLPVNFIKLDRSIMEHITENLEIQNLTKGIIRLAHKKKLSVTAEFCSNKSITDMAIMLGVDYLQGFYFAEAGPESYSQSEQLNCQSN